MPRWSGIEEGHAIFVHELHERKQDGPARLAKLRMHGQGRDLGDVAFLGANAAQIEDGLQRKAKNAVADQRQGADHLAVVLGAQRGSGWQGMINRYPQTGRVRFHESGIYIGIVQQPKTGLQFLLRLGDLQLQAIARRRIAIDERAIDGKALIARQKAKQLAQCLAKHFHRALPRDQKGVKLTIGVQISMPFSCSATALALRRSSVAF